MPIVKKPGMNDIVIRVRLKLDTYGLSKFDSVAELIAEANKISAEIMRHVDGVYDASVCSDADGHLEQLGEWNKASWMDWANPSDLKD